MLDATGIQVTIQTTFASAYCVKVDRSWRERRGRHASGGGGRVAEGGRLDSGLAGVDRTGRRVVETRREQRTRVEL